MYLTAQWRIYDFVALGLSIICRLEARPKISKEEKKNVINYQNQYLSFAHQKNRQLLKATFIADLLLLGEENLIAPPICRP